ncbi:hypothetical protein Q0590_24850 [Rhodocytophaga aerolata]|uniref:Uncharacterized protein n=1 Tax=Rhodocytophaga aerolata TaxID=455078 RepID=A0ABT8RDV7_9BACT|nr:hypothetical protein [Rhodocytophaga aerolata]MDO1449529.1 hypothetical protein [Rhodocytophaga aerolata]
MKIDFEEYLNGFTPSYRKKLEEIIGLAQVELTLCNEKNTPHVCVAKSTIEGMKEIILKIVRICGATGMTVSEAIAQIERELNPFHPDVY